MTPSLRSLACLSLAFFPALGARGSAEPPSVETLREGVLSVLNAEREKHKAAALTSDPLLQKTAQSRAERAAGAADLSSIEDESGDHIFRRTAEAGYDPLAVAEIVMLGEGQFEERLDALARRDPETFAEAMSRQYRNLGVGIAEGEERVAWVLLFGLKIEDDFARRTADLADLQKIRIQMLELVNARRLERRLPPLHENALLDQAAQNHAEDMIRRSYYSHDSPEKGNVDDRVRKINYKSIAVGENIAEGQSSVAEVMEGWMSSPEHRDHILSLELKEIGVGMAFGKNGRGWTIVWVQVFAAPRTGWLRRRR